MLKETLYYIRTHILTQLIVATTSFFLAVFFGVLYAFYFTVDASTIFNVLAEEFSGIFDMGQVTTMLAIFFNNAIKTALAIILGIFLGIAPLLFIVTNGFIIGVVGFFFYSSDKLATFFIGILPHGIFEIPALIISGAIGIYFGKLVYKWIFKGKTVHVKKHFMQGINVFTHFIIPLLFIASFIEVFITTILIDFIV